ncbi:unannotated protein [freshwater metagenome]|uniref:Unannotated protein n=1 Tax=freshwater metagenome TaxID=449393 RepID=A0A6J6HXZ1_9ZZZZ
MTAESKNEEGPGVIRGLLAYNGFLASAGISPPWKAEQLNARAPGSLLMEAM